MDNNNYGGYGQQPPQQQNQYQQPYQQDQYQQPYQPNPYGGGGPPIPPSNPGKGMAIVSLIFGIVSLVLCWWPVTSVVALILGVIGLILGIIGKKKCSEAGVSGGLATTGLILSSVGLGFGFIFSIIYCVACNAGGGCSAICAACDEINRYS